jgi:enolase
MIIKPNQNGSLIELQKIFELCKANHIKTILSHRSGETMDASIADYAFAFQADFIKCGISTAFREAKLKRMLEIESSLRL